MNPQSDGDRPADGEHRLAPDGGAYRVRYRLRIVLVSCGARYEHEEGR